MERMCGGDVAALWSLVSEFETELKRSVEHHLRSIGRNDLCGDEDFLSGLVMDVALLLMGTRSWSPSGALPWVWAGRAISHLVGEAAGHRSVPIEDHHVEVATSPASLSLSGPEVGLSELAATNSLVGILHDAISVVGSERDQRVHIDYQTQIADGDPSPSHTVAESHGISPSNVRQIDRRMRVKLQRLAVDEARFSGLEDLRWLA